MILFICIKIIKIHSMMDRFLYFPLLSKNFINFLKQYRLQINLAIFYFRSRIQDDIGEEDYLVLEAWCFPPASYRRTYSLYKSEYQHNQRWWRNYFKLDLPTICFINKCFINMNLHHKKQWNRLLIKILNKVKILMILLLDHFY